MKEDDEEPQTRKKEDKEEDEWGDYSYWEEGSEGEKYEEEKWNYEGEEEEGFVKELEGREKKSRNEEDVGKRIIKKYKKKVLIIRGQNGTQLTYQSRSGFRGKQEQR